MPTPPTRGVAAPRHRLWSGIRSSPSETRVRSRTQTASMVAGRAVTAASALTGGEGRRPVLGPCLPARGVPTLLRADDGLLRPAALPRAFREPVPARFPREVQGVGARCRVVAVEPARPPGRLSRRLRRTDQKRRHTALPDLPARRARLLDLLLGLAAVRGALDDRQRRADQEGAVPAPARRPLDGRDAGSHLRADDRHPGRAL